MGKKKINAVEMTRKIRDEHAKQLAKKSHAERIAFYSCRNLVRPGERAEQWYAARAKVGGDSRVPRPAAAAVRPGRKPQHSRTQEGGTGSRAGHGAIGAVMLDELVAGLNPTEMESLMAVVRKINRQGVSLLIVEHVMRVVAGLCDRVIVLHHGQKLVDGPTERVLNDRQVAEAYLGRSYVERLGNSGLAPDHGGTHGK